MTDAASAAYNPAALAAERIEAFSILQQSHLLTEPQILTPEPDRGGVVLCVVIVGDAVWRGTILAGLSAGSKISLPSIFGDWQKH